MIKFIVSENLRIYILSFEIAKQQTGLGRGANDEIQGQEEVDAWA